MTNYLLRRFDTPDETRTFTLGRLDLIRIAGTTLGRARYEPGWRWSQHVAPLAGTRSCQVAHLGLVLEGRAMVRMDDGTEYELKAGDVFQIAPGHDSWVLGDRPYVSIHLTGADQYAT
ncbi:MAG TPA: cupin domain-containing protein [Gemmatimonadales bacterium]|nr:cupin domain-containing protein [Gemmatimonadales bacterium]